MALIPMGPWKRDSTYRVHPLGLKDSTYRVPLLDSKLVRLRYVWYYRIKSPSGPSSALAALGTPQSSFWTLNAVEPRLTYPNLYLVLVGQTFSCKTLRQCQSLVSNLHRVLYNYQNTNCPESFKLSVNSTCLEARLYETTLTMSLVYSTCTCLHILLVQYNEMCKKEIIN